MYPLSQRRDLFILGAEILSLYLKQRGEIDDIKLGNYNYLVSQLADDTLLAIIELKANVRKCFTKFFDLKSGAYQGCPLSQRRDLFILGAEIFSLYLKQRGEIEGIKLGN